MNEYYLAIDIGASSGRHILCHMEDGKMVLQEIHRFENGMILKDGHLSWDTEKLFAEILNGLRKCKEAGMIPRSLGIDTWGVDFVLLDEKDQLIGSAVGYRDSRTNGMDEAVYQIIPEEKLYARTGIQKEIFNTIYQLMAVKKTAPEQLEQARTFLMIPDYFNFLLTGEKCAEYTESSTSQLLNPEQKNWDYELLEMLGIPTEIFPEIRTPGTFLGHFTKEVEEAVGFNCDVLLPATHDTGSAVLAVPSIDDTVYISSGTWSLMGIERMQADCSMESMHLNFTNEGGYQYRFRYLKNIMGLWMIQSVKKELKAAGQDYSFAELADGAAVSKIRSIVPCNDGRFLAPASMTEEIQKACRESGQEVPVNAFDLAAVVYNSLAVCYLETVEGLEKITGRKYDHINVVGGGSNNEYLSRVTAKVTGRTVYAGPGEATAIGNMLVQMLHYGVFADLSEARSCVFDSFSVKTYQS